MSSETANRRANATAGVVRTWRWTIVADVPANLPRAEVAVSIAPALEGRFRVQAIDLTLPDRGREVAHTRAFCDGRMVVDYAPDGRVAGAEFLARTDARAVHRLAAFSGARTPDAALLAAAHATATLIWARVQLLLDVLAAQEGGAGSRSLARALSRTRPVELLSARPDSRNWCTLDHGARLAAV